MCTTRRLSHDPSFTSFSVKTPKFVNAGGAPLEIFVSRGTYLLRDGPNVMYYPDDIPFFRSKWKTRGTHQQTLRTPSTISRPFTHLFFQLKLEPAGSGPAEGSSCCPA